MAKSAYLKLEKLGKLGNLVEKCKSKIRKTCQKVQVKLGNFLILDLINFLDLAVD